MADLTLEPRKTGASLDKAWPFLIAGAVLVAQLLALYFLYHPNRFIFECRAHAPAIFCGALSPGAMRAGAVIGVLAVFVLARPAVLATLRAGLRPGWGWGALQIAGVLAIFAPLGFLEQDIPPAVFLGAVALWLTGLAAATVGTLFFFVRPAAWQAAARTGGPLVLVLAVLAALLPDIAPLIRDQVQYLWQYEPVTEITFHATTALLVLSGEEVYSNLTGPQIGVAEFVVGVGRQCSGVEGFVLISGFLGLYFWLFRDRLRFPRVWLLLPLGLLLSWCLNVVRIAVLIWIGAFYSPELAIEGFHSHAGWLMFTILSVGFAATAHRIAWFRKDALAGSSGAEAAGPATIAPPAPRLPFFRDPVAAQIFPFLVFMASALLASTFSQTPAVLYPLRALAMAAALVAFWPVLARIKWQPDMLALSAGGGIGVLWLVTAPAAGASDEALTAALAAMPPALFVLWVFTRIIGTAVLVPVIEELFFRGYVLGRLDRGGLVWRLLALTVSAALFAALHDRWLAAGLAGLVFGLLALRKGHIADAIWAHAMANAIIAGWAVWHGDWSVI